MNALRISLGILLAVTLAYALEKDDLSAANDAQQVNVGKVVEMSYGGQVIMGRGHPILFGLRCDGPSLQCCYRRPVSRVLSRPPGRFISPVGVVTRGDRTNAATTAAQRTVSTARRSIVAVADRPTVKSPP